LGAYSGSEEKRGRDSSVPWDCKVSRPADSGVPHENVVEEFREKKEDPGIEGRK